MASSSGDQRPASLVLVTAGDPARRTGGNLYNRRILATLRAAGLAAAEVALPERGRPAALLRAELGRRRPALVVVDSLALDGAVPLLPWLSRSLGARVVALMHMLPSDLVPDGERTRRLESRLLRAADRVVAVSPHLGDRLVAAGAPIDRIAVIPPGRDGVPPPPTSAVHRRGPGFRLLCVANWSPAKGIHDLVSALGHLPPQVHLDLVGEEGDGAYADEIRAALQAEPLAGRVHVHGSLDGEGVARLYASADAFVLPSRSEGFGTAYAEALSFGLPVVACRSGPVPWLVGEGCGLLVPDGDVVALAEAMGRLVADPARCQAMGAAARERARQLPTWRESGERFRRLVAGLLAAPPLRAPTRAVDGPR